MTPTLEEQIAELRREIGLRERVYPGWIAAKKMKADQAERSMARIKAALETLEGLSGDGVCSLAKIAASLRQREAHFHGAQPACVEHTIAAAAFSEALRIVEAAIDAARKEFRA